MPGYRLARPDQQTIRKKYLCISCNLLLRDAMQIGCGHHCCSSCLGSLRGSNDTGEEFLTCTQDMVQLLPCEVFPDNFMRREVQSLIVHCTFMEDGCQWTGEVRHLENHTISCEFQKVPCVYPECDMLVKKADLLDHLEKNCKCRLETCGFCKRKINLNKMRLHQERECPAYPVMCFKCYKDGIPRSKLHGVTLRWTSSPYRFEVHHLSRSSTSADMPFTLTEHQDPLVGDCDGIQGPCPFTRIGCCRAEILSRREIRKHLVQENSYHTTLVLQYALRMSREMEGLLMHDPGLMTRRPHLFRNYDSVISNLITQAQTLAAENRELREKCREHSERIASLERKLASNNFLASAPSSNGGGQSPDVTRRLIDLESRTADHEVQLMENNRSVEQSSRDVCYVRRQLDTLQEAVRRLEGRIDSIEHTLALRNVTLADLEEYVRQQEFSSHDGQLLWKITGCARKRNEAVNGQRLYFDSPPFYTSRYGYKMCARIYLNGDGMGRGTHISVFLVVMRGQYDAVLRWPFRQKVTFTLLDQDNEEHVIDAFRPDPRSSSFQRPRRETNIASGCPMFCSLSELNNHGYVRDNTMFIRVTVDTSDTGELGTPQALQRAWQEAFTNIRAQVDDLRQQVQLQKQNCDLREFEACRESDTRQIENVIIERHFEAIYRIIAELVRNSPGRRPERQEGQGEGRQNSREEGGQDDEEEGGQNSQERQEEGQ